MNIVLPSGVSLDTGRGGLSRLTAATSACRAELYLHGAHLCHWQPRDHPNPVLWMSRASQFEAGAPIRGGVPICFPWFGPKAGDPAAPGHGVARIRIWELGRVDAEADGTVTVELALTSDAAARGSVPHDFSLSYTIRLGRTLSMALTVINPGPLPMTFEEALHTYLAVADVRNVGVAGLSGATYIDKTDGATRKVQTKETVTIAGETDRLYVDTTAAVTLTDPGLGRTISIVKTGSRSSVVWNPWIAKSRAMPDFGDEEWPGIICIETANAADDAVTLLPGDSHTMTATVSVSTVA